MKNFIIFLLLPCLSTSCSKSSKDNFELTKVGEFEMFDITIDNLVDLYDLAENEVDELMIEELGYTKQKLSGGYMYVPLNEDGKMNADIKDSQTVTISGGKDKKVVELSVIDLPEKGSYFDSFKETYKEKLDSKDGTFFINHNNRDFIIKLGEDIFPYVRIIELELPKFD